MPSILAQPVFQDFEFARDTGGAPSIVCEKGRIEEAADGARLVATVVGNKETAAAMRGHKEFERVGSSGFVFVPTHFPIVARIMNPRRKAKQQTGAATQWQRDE